MKKYISASSNSKILAIFWYYQGQFIGEERLIDSDNVVQYGDYLQVDSDHFIIWPKYRQLLHLPATIEYDQIPRGRVMFNTKIHKFVVIGSNAIVDDDAVKDKLRAYYSLPTTTIFEHDEHYG